MIIDPINHNFGFRNNGLAIINIRAPNVKAPRRTPITVSASEVEAL